MTIIKNANAMANYPFTFLPPEVLKLMHLCFEQCQRTNYKQSLIKLFEAYCHVTGTAVTYLSLSTPAFGVVIKSFIGALADESFLAGSRLTRTAYAKEFNDLIDVMRTHVPLIPLLGKDERLPGANTKEWEHAKLELDPVAVRYWNGWSIVDAKGFTRYLPISLIWLSHGQEFAEQVYKSYRQHSEKKVRPNVSEMIAFIAFISDEADQWPVETFTNPIKINKCFIAFMIKRFTKAAENDLNIPGTIKNYATFILSIEEAFLIPGTWAKPFAGTLPKPASKLIHGTHSHLRQGTDGELVHEKLITPIPLQIKDSEAIEILFKRIHEDISLVLKWARRKSYQLRQAQLQRDQLARTGTSNTHYRPSARTIEDIGIADLCATFDEHGLAYIRKDFQRKFGERVKKQEVATHLALPRPNDFISFQLQLIAGHPCLGESFFSDFELYDKNGREFGFIKEENGYLLTGYKDRKGGAKSQQRIKLTPRQAVLVRQVIAITQPLRDELKAAGDDNWRCLFLHSFKAVSYPSKCNPPRWRTTLKPKHLEALITEFSQHCAWSKEKLGDFIVRVSLTTFRASCGVAKYLETQSLTEMAKALGHAKYDSHLLSKYLPDAILAFFQTRWIRVFQRGIICEAMKNSPNILLAAKFASMEELHTFLENHAFRDLPEHLQNPEYLAQSQRSTQKKPDAGQTERVLISVDTGILTALISINQAVENSTRKDQINSQALYWSQFADLVAKDIDRGWNTELQDYLATARLHAKPSHMEALIYATAS